MQDCDARAIVLEHWPAFREHIEMLAGPLPRFVRDEIEALGQKVPRHRGPKGAVAR